MLTNRFSITLATLCILLPSAWAASVSLTPGSSVTPGNNDGTFNPNTGAVGYTEVAIASGVIGPPALSVTGVERVYRNNNACLGGAIGCGGELQFFVQLVNTGADSLKTIDVTNFLGYQTSVGYINLGGESDPNSADRGVAGDVVNFNFLNGSNQGTLMGTSDWLEIDTNATTFAETGTVGFIDGGAYSITAYAPTGVPEPATTGMVGAALALMVLVARRRLPNKA